MLAFIGWARRVEVGGVGGWGMGVGRAYVFAADQTPPSSHERTVEKTVHKTVLANYQQLPSILRPTSLLPHPCLSPTTKRPSL